MGGAQFLWNCSIFSRLRQKQRDVFFSLSFSVCLLENQLRELEIKMLAKDKDEMYLKSGKQNEMFWDLKGNFRNEEKARWNRFCRSHKSLLRYIFWDVKSPYLVCIEKSGLQLATDLYSVVRNDCLPPSMVTGGRFRTGKNCFIILNAWNLAVLLHFVYHSCHN